MEESDTDICARLWLRTQQEFRKISPDDVDLHSNGSMLEKRVQLEDSASSCPGSEPNSFPASSMHRGLFLLAVPCSSQELELLAECKDKFPMQT